MKTIIYISFIYLLLLSCSYRYNRNGPKNTQIENGYKVYKIDSFKNVYSIYAKRKDSIYKIISHKEFSADGERLKLNHYYKFILVCVFKKKYDLVDGILYYDTPISIEPDSIMTLYSAENIVGLNFINHMKSFTFP